MSYVVLARKYRPQNFEDLVGQLPVSQTLLNAIQSGRIAHAYVFSGPRGVGKTTTARLLAKCLNCEKGPTVKPCNKCPSCESIALGSSVQDVLEIDGASNRGIEQIRELRESAKYAPSSSRYRIYIIDEAHQITKDAFGALLKTLEEPPAHVVFMMATTEVQKIPAPILSRCQRFSLRPIVPELVLKHLKEICQKEKVKVEEEALADIVRFVEGSLRDALSLLDQAIVFSPEGITSNTLRDLLGLLPREVIRTTAQLLAEGDPALILKHISQSIQNGIDLMQLGKDLQEYYHTLLLVKAGVGDVFQTDIAQLKADAGKHEFGALERNIRLLSRAMDEMRRSESPRAVFEVSVLKIAQKLLDPRVLLERLEKLSPYAKAPGDKGLPSVAPAKEGRPSPAASAATPLPQTSNPVRNQTPIEAKEVKKENNPDMSPNSLSESGVNAAWPTFLNEVADIKVALASALEEARISVRNGALILTFGKLFNQQMVDRSTAVLKPLLDRHFGSAVRLETRTEANGTALPAPSAAPVAARPQIPAPAVEESIEMEVVPAEEAGEDVKKALKFFQGTVRKEKKTS